MPELPDIEAYLAALRPRVLHEPLEGLRIGDPFVVRTIEPPPTELIGRRVAAVRRMGKEEVERLYHATRRTLGEWTARLRAEAAESFPEKVTAFRPGMAVHGRYGQPCPVCGAAVQRIVYARNEANYCSRCQTEGRLLSDRALSRLLRDDWPRTLEELEARRTRA